MMDFNNYDLLMKICTIFSLANFFNVEFYNELVIVIFKEKISQTTHYMRSLHSY